MCVCVCVDDGENIEGKGYTLPVRSTSHAWDFSSALS